MLRLFACQIDSEAEIVVLASDARFFDSPRACVEDVFKIGLYYASARACCAACSVGKRSIALNGFFLNRVNGGCAVIKKRKICNCIAPNITLFSPCDVLGFRLNGYVCRGCSGFNCERNAARAQRIFVALVSLCFFAPYAQYVERVCDYRLAVCLCICGGVAVNSAFCYAVIVCLACVIAARHCFRQACKAY